MEKWRELFNDLRIKQRRFVVAYVKNGGNGTQASKEAEYQCKTDNAHAANASEILTNPKIKEAVNAYEAGLSRKTQEKVEYTREMAIAEYEEAKQIAIEKGIPGAICTAIAGKISLCGLGIKAADNPQDKQPLTREELLAALAELDGVEEEARTIQLQTNQRVRRKIG